jgi:ABC-type Zn uptake system ZnuABC Zn-binding protein ZnuA
LDPHTFEPTPQDITRIAQSQVLIVNGAGFEEWLQEVLDNAGGERWMIEAAEGLQTREPQAKEEMHAGEGAEAICAVPDETQAQEAEDCEPGETGSEAEEEHEHEGDPHFWLDPNLVIRYVENIRDGLSRADPEGKEVFQQNAEAYIEELRDLDIRIADQVDQIPPGERLMITNHESLGYFADRYGFTIIGTVIPGVSTGASPSAQQLSGLIDKINATGVKAIFLETGANPELAEQIARETSVNVIRDLYTHSISPPDGDAPTYLDMMLYNTEVIVNALK